MGFWSAIAAPFRLTAETTDGTRGAFDPRYWGVDVLSSAAGLMVNWQSALQLDVVQATLARLSGTVSTLPLMVFERSGPNGDEVKPVRTHPLFKLLHRRPNGRQTAQEFRSEQVHHLAYWRNSFSQIVPDPETGAPIGSLEQIHPSRLKNIFRAPDGHVYYVFSKLAPDTGDLTLRDDDIWHVRMAPLTADGLRGQFTWESSRETFGRALAVENFGSLYFANGGSGGGVLEHPGTFKDKEEQNKFIKVWRDSGGGSNRHKDRMLLNGVKYNRQVVNNDEAQFLETKKEMGAAVARIWNMPLHMVGLLDKATFSNIEQQSLEYVIYTVTPFISAIEQSAWRDLLVGEDQDKYFVEHNVNGLLRGDWKSRWQGYAWGRQWGWLSVNMILRMENVPGIGDAGDVFLTPMNMSATGSPAADGTALPAGDDKDPDTAPEDDENAP